MTLDLTTGFGLTRALLPEIVLAIWAMAVLLWGVARSDAEVPADRVHALGWFALAGILVAGVLNGWLYAMDAVGDSGMLVIDGFRLFANWIFLIAAGLSILVSFPYVIRQRLQAGEFYSLILMATVGMMVMGGTKNLILLFIALETMSIGSYVLTAYHRRDRKSAEAGLKYFVLGAFASGFLLYGITLIWGATGSVDLGVLAQRVEEGAGFTRLLLAGLGLLGIGFAFKVGAVPFHMWTPDVYEGAPSPSTAFMAAAVKAASFVAFLRVFVEGFAVLHASWYPVLWWLAAFTMVVGNLIALSQTNVKRMLAYSSVAHGGYLLVGLASANAMASAGVLFYLFVYTAMTVGAFGILMIVSQHGEDRLQIEDYSGFGWRQPFLGVLFTIFLLALAGFPGTGGFMAKIFLLQGAAQSGLWKLAILLALATVVSYYYYLRLAWYMWMRPSPSGEAPVVWVPISTRAALLGTAVLLIFLGVFPGELLQTALLAVEELGAAGTGVVTGLIP